MNKKSILFGASLMSAAAAFAYVDITSDVTWTEMPDVGDGSGFYIFSPAGGSVTVNVDFESASENPLPLFQIASDGWASQGRDVVNFNADSCVKTRLEVGNFNSADSSTGEMNVASGVSLAVEGFASVGSTNDSHSSDKRFAINLGKNSAMSTTSYFDVNKNGTLTIENGAKLIVGDVFNMRGTAVANINGGTLQASFVDFSAVDGKYPTINLNGGTIHMMNAWDQSFRSVLNVSGKSVWIFNQGRAYKNEAEGVVRISDGGQLQLKMAEGSSDQSYFCNYGTLIVEASTASNSDAALVVDNFVEDSTPGVIALDFSKITGTYEDVAGIVISATNGLSISQTTLKYTLNGIDFFEIIGGIVEDGDLSLSVWTEGNSLMYTYSIPEPSTCAAIFGALALAFAAFRRKR